MSAGRKTPQRWLRNAVGWGSEVESGESAESGKGGEGVELSVMRAVEVLWFESL
jgi:hypothetical protein